MIAVDLWLFIVSINRYFGIKIVIFIATVIFDLIIDVVTDSIYYRRFYHYKNSGTMNILSLQCKMGIIAVFIMDVVICAIPSFKLDLRSTFYYIHFKI